MKATVWLMATIAAFSLTAYGTAAKTTNVWAAVSGSGNWSEPTNWSLGRIPEASDKVEFRDIGKGDYMVNVDVDSTITEVWFEAGSGSLTTTLSGSGTITTTGSELKLMSNRYVVMNGPSINNRSQLFLYGSSTLEVCEGSTVTTPHVYFHANDTTLMINGGTLNVTSCINLKYIANNKNLVINSGTLKTPKFSNYGDAGTKTFACRVNGGVMEIADLVLTNSFHTLRQSGGTIRITNSYNLTGATLDLNGGTIEVAYDFSDADINGLRSLSSGSKVIAPNARLTTTTTDCMTVTGVLETAGIYNKVNGGSFDLDTVVFTGGANKPFDYGGTKWNYNVYLQGPTTLRAKADMTPDWTSATESGVVVYARDEMTFDTSDPEEPTANHVLFFEGFSSNEGAASLRAIGGGTVKLLTRKRLNSYNAVTIEDDTTLELLATPSGQSLRGHVKTERFTMGANSTLRITAGENFIEAADWLIDSTAQIIVTLPSDFTEGARAILRDMDSENLPDGWLSQVTLAGSTEGAAIKNDHGQITVYKRASAADLGKYGAWEWTGAGNNAYWCNPDNWFGGEYMPEKTTAVFGSSSVTNSYIDSKLKQEGGALKGSTIGAITFQTNAVDTFTITPKDGQRTFSNSAAVTSYSSVPQILEINPRIKNRNNAFGSYADAPVVFMSYFTFAGNYSTTIDGDIRFGYTGDKALKLPRIAFATATGFASAGTVLTILPGATCTITNQSEFYGIDCGFRVAEDGKLVFADGTFQLCRNMATHVINGTLDIKVPYIGSSGHGIRSVYRGSGCINIPSNQPSSQNTRVIFGDTLQVYYGASNWLTAETGKGGCFSVGARGTPTLHVADGWSYGHGSETTTNTVDKYQMTIEKGGVLSIDADGGEIAFTDPFVGPGAIALVNAKLALGGAFETTAGVRVDNGGILEITDDQTIGGLSAKGGTLKVAADKTLTVAGDINAANLAFDGLTQTWRTYAVATGEITGTDAAKDAKARVVEADGVKYLQARLYNGGLLMIVR